MKQPRPYRPGTGAIPALRKRAELRRVSELMSDKPGLRYTCTPLALAYDLAVMSA